jgi:C4-dicarboxylate-specific signal transduction histidine kinase
LSPSGDLVEIVGSSIDVTERKRAEEARLNAQNKLSHANRVATTGQLAASIAHEINQPITGVVANARAALRFLGAQPMDLYEVRHTLKEIVKDGNRAGEIIARIRALVTKLPSRKDRLDINEVILEVIALTRSEIVRNGISLKTELAKELPPVHGERTDLQQVLLNLIVNAVDAMSSESNSLRELLIATSEDRSNGVRVAVSDWGPGVAQEAIERLFDAFYTTKSGGMGMGLAICRSIIKAHGGRIWVTPNTPRGAVFQFNLPVREPQP